MVRTERLELRVDEDLLQRIDDWMEQTGRASSRSDALRQLVDIGLGTMTGRTVHLSAGDKLNFMLLRDIAKHLMSFSEDDCTNQRDMKPAVHTAPDSPISGLLCTKLVYAQYSCAPKRGEHGDRYRTDCRARRSHPVRTGMGACSLPRGDHWAVGAVGDGRA